MLLLLWCFFVVSQNSSLSIKEEQFIWDGILFMDIIFSEVLLDERDSSESFWFVSVLFKLPQPVTFRKNVIEVFVVVD